MNTQSKGASQNLLGLVIVFLMFATGCVSESVSGTEIIYTYEWWTWLLAFLGGLGAIAAGVFVLGSSVRFAIVLVIGGVISTFGVAPNMFMEKVIVREDGFQYWLGGFMGMGQNVADIKFANIISVSLTSTETTGRRGRKSTSYFMWIDCKDGDNIKMPLSNELCSKALAAIGDGFRKHEIPVNDRTN